MLRGRDVGFAINISRQIGTIDAEAPPGDIALIVEAKAKAFECVTKSMSFKQCSTIL